MDLTINNILRTFSRIQQAAEGDLLKSFRYGNMSEVNDKPRDLFPMLFVEYPFQTNYTYAEGGWWKGVNFSYLVLDRHSEQDSRPRGEGDPSIRDIIGKCEQTAEQILAYLHKSLDRCNLDVTKGGANGFSFTEQHADVLTGYQIALSINGPSPVDNCAPIFATVDLCALGGQESNCYY